MRLPDVGRLLARRPRRRAGGAPRPLPPPPVASGGRGADRVAEVAPLAEVIDLTEAVRFAPRPTELPSATEPVERQVREALDARAATARVSDDAWVRVLELRETGVPVGAALGGSARRPLLVAAAAAAAVFLVIGAIVQPRLRLDSTSPFPAGDSQSEQARPGGTDSSVAPGVTVPATGSTLPETSATPEPDNRPPAPLSSIHAVDLRNATFPGAPCSPDASPEAGSFTLVDGRAPAPGGSSAAVSLQQVVYGDVNGDGQDEAVARFSCPVGGGGQSGLVTVIGIVNGTPTVVGTIAESGSSGSVQIATDDVGSQPRNVGLHESIDSVSVADGSVVVEFRQSAADLTPARGDYAVTARYRLVDGKVEQESVSQPRPVASAEPATPPGYSAVRDAVRSLAVPLAAAGRDSRSQVCGDVFDLLGGAADVKLSQGTATVVNAVGLPVGTVTLTDSRFGRLTGGPLEDALVLLTCQAGDRSTAVPLVVTMRGGVAVVADVVAPPQTGARATAVQVVGDGTAVATWRNPVVAPGQDGTTWSQSLHWDGQHLRAS